MADVSRKNWHGAVVGIEPLAEEMEGRRPPDDIDAIDVWSRWHCFRGIGCAGSEGLVHVSLAQSHEPLDEAKTVNFDVASFDIASAKELAHRLQRAIEAAERTLV